MANGDVYLKFQELGILYKVKPLNRYNLNKKKYKEK